MKKFTIQIRIKDGDGFEESYLLPFTPKNVDIFDIRDEVESLLQKKQREITKFIALSCKEVMR